MLFSYVLVLYSIQSDISDKCQSVCRLTLNPVSYRSCREQKVIRDLLEQPDLSLRPIPSYSIDPPGTHPVLIWTRLNLESISTVKEQNMEFKAQFRFQQEWNDHRLTFRDEYIRPPFDQVHVAQDQVDRIWRPDTFFQNEKNGHSHTVDHPNFSFLISSDGSIVYNRRMTLVFSCVMNFVKYPMDTQTCEIHFASYAYTTSDIIYLWKDPPLNLYHSAISTLPNFVIRSFNNGTCSSVTNTGEYSCLKVVIRLQRDFSFFVLQVYLPSTMLVAVAWLSYWIDWQATAARFPLVLFTLLTVVAQTHMISSNLPPVSYTKAIDLWGGACTAFVFASMIEYAVVNYLAIKDMKPRPKNTVQYGVRVWDKLEEWIGVMRKWTTCAWTMEKISPFRRQRKYRRRTGAVSYDCRLDSFMNTVIEYDECVDDHKRQLGMCFDQCPRIRLSGSQAVKLVHRALKGRSRAERIDIISRYLYPTSFIMFNIVYWAVYW